MDKSSSPSLVSLGLTALVITAALVYGFIALSTEDPLWFTTTFDAYPEAIDVHCYGGHTTMRPGDDDFDELVAVINETLSGSKNYDPLTMSVETYEYYLTSEAVMALELVYSQKVRIHSFYRFFSNLDSIVIPLDGRHAASNAIFGRANNLSTSGSLHYAGMPAVRAFVESSGICQAK